MSEAIHLVIIINFIKLAVKSRVPITIKPCTVLRLMNPIRMDPLATNNACNKKVQTCFSFEKSLTEHRTVQEKITTTD